MYSILLVHRSGSNEDMRMQKHRQKARYGCIPCTARYSSSDVHLNAGGAVRATQRLSPPFNRV